MNSKNKRVLERVETHYLSLSQMSACTRVDETIIVELIESDILCPQNDESENWLFIAEDLSRLTRANRLMHEFELTPVGLALVFDLLEELRELRAR